MNLPTKPIIYTILVAMVILLGLIFFSDNGLMELRRLQREKERIAQQNMLLTKNNYHLYRTIERLRGDRVYLEYIARSELGLVGTRQIIFKLADIGQETPYSKEKP